MTNINFNVSDKDKVLLRMIPFIKLAMDNRYLFEYDVEKGQVTISVPVLVEETENCIAPALPHTNKEKNL